MDDALSSASTNPVQNKAVTKVILDNERVIATSINDLNERINNLRIDVDTEMDSASTNPVENRVLYQVITDNEETVAAALNDLNDRIDNFSIDVDSEMDSASTNPVENRVVWNTIMESEMVAAAALNDLNARKSDVDYVDEAISSVTSSIAWENGSGANSAVLKGSEGQALAEYSTAEGYRCIVGGGYTANTIDAGAAPETSGAYGHAEGRATIASGRFAHSEGNRTLASGNYAHAEGNQNVAEGNNSHAEGFKTYAEGPYSHASGYSVRAIGYGSHACGIYGLAVGDYSALFNGDYVMHLSVTGGANALQYTGITEDGEILNLFNGLTNTDFNNVISKTFVGKTGNILNTLHYIKSVVSSTLSNDKLTIVFTVSETLSSTALNNDNTWRLSFAMAVGDYSFSANNSLSYGASSHSEGRGTLSLGVNSHAEGHATYTRNASEHAEGRNNVSHSASTTYGDSGNTQHSVGIGTSYSGSKNAFEIMQNGDMYVYGLGGYNGKDYATATTLQNVVSPKVVTSKPSTGFLPNVLYNLGTISGSQTFTLAAPVDSTVINHYYWTFDTGTSAPTITWPSGITKWYGGSTPTVSANGHYEVSVLNGVGVLMEIL
jgi:hypothetical protein